VYTANYPDDARAIQRKKHWYQRIF
jgi:hypothetical protein